METTMGNRWAMPAFGLLLGVLFLAASAVGGQPAMGLGMLAVMAIYSGVLVAFGRRREMVGVLGGVPVDERLASFNLRATSIAGTVALGVALAGFTWRVAQGEGGADFAVVAAAGGIAYLAAILWLRSRG
jgi:hypothetical protein